VASAVWPAQVAHSPHGQLLYLKHSFNASSEELVARWSENIVWQSFSAMESYNAHG